MGVLGSEVQHGRSGSHRVGRSAGTCAAHRVHGTPPNPRAPRGVGVHRHGVQDIFILLRALPGFKFVSKRSVFFIPVIGWVMAMTGHVSLHRTDRASQAACLRRCGELLDAGCCVAFFPEGTRSCDGRLQPFKKGAFVLAARRRVPVVPVTIQGAAQLMPRLREYLLFPGTIKVTIHPAIPPRKPTEMTSAAHAAVGSVMPRHLVAPSEDRSPAE